MGDHKHPVLATGILYHLVTHPHHILATAHKTYPHPAGLISDHPLLPSSHSSQLEPHWCLLHGKHIPTSGPLHLLVLLPGTIFPSDISHGVFPHFIQIPIKFLRETSPDQPTCTLRPSEVVLLSLLWKVIVEEEGEMNLCVGPFHMFLI